MADPKQIYLPVARALAQTSIARERLLPRPGMSTVKPGDRVEPVDTVARTFVPLAPFVVNIAQMFKVSSLRAHSLLLKKVGDSFEKDEVLARKRSLLGKGLVCRAPSPGRLLAEHRGEVLLELAPTTLDLHANLKGTVANASRFGVVIISSGALVQGVWGNGTESFGVLKLLSEVREQPLTADMVDVSALGSIVVAGGAVDAEGLRQAETQQVRGLVLGSMPASLRAQAQALPFPVMLTEGFGSTPMAGAVFDLFRMYNGREAALRAIVKTRWGAQRPELFVPLIMREGVSSDTAPQFAVLQKDALVRVCAGEHLGAVARVVGAEPHTRVFPNGVRARAIEVELNGGEHIWTPVNNLEAIA